MGQKINQVLEHIAVENQHDLAAMLATLDDDNPVRDETAGICYVGRIAVADRYSDLWQAFPDFTVTPRVLHETDHSVVMQADYSGTHAGMFDGHTPTGNKFSVRIVVVFEFVGDKISKETIYSDLAGQLRQLDLLPSYHGSST